MSPSISIKRKALNLAHAFLTIPAAYCNQLSSLRHFHKSMIGPTEVHLWFLKQTVISLIELKQLLSLLPSAYIDLSSQLTLKNSWEVSKAMLHTIKVKGPLLEVFEIMNHELLLIWNEYRYSVIFRKELKTSLSSLSCISHLCKTWKIYLRMQLGKLLFKVLSFLKNLIT